MALSNDIVSQFAKAVTTKNKRTEKTVSGTVVEYQGKKYVQLDGSEQYTPVSATAGYEVGERVTVLIKDHTATVTGNLSSPAARTETVEKLTERVAEVDELVAKTVTTEELNAEIARINEIVADNVTIKDQLTADKADIESLKAVNVEITGQLTAAEAEIEKIKTDKLDAVAADIKYATIESLNATNATIYDLDVTFGDFKELTTDNFEAVNATINSLDTKYANIDFANITEASIENFYAKSGVIQDVVISDGQVTGTLVGVTIKGDLIEGGTVVADKLVIKGEDGLYYKLNTNGETVSSEQTDYNSLNGTIITAKSVTAEKIAVDDLVAFDATIGGFIITEDSLYSGVKASVNNTTRGVYLDNTGQVAFGDTNNFLKYYKDTDGQWKLSISAQSVTFGVNNTNIEDVAANAIVSSVEEFYQSTSPTSLVGGSWSTEQPEWTEGTYIWRRTAITYGDGSSEYTPSQNGVCITGNTGASGEDGADGKDGQMLYAKCTTSASTSNKVATLTSGSITLTSGVSVAVTFSYANTSSSPYLNVNSSGNKKITFGASSTVTDWYRWVAGSTITFIYDGSYWVIADSCSYTRANDAAKVATNYMNFDSNGLVVGNMTASTLGNNVLIDADSVDIRMGETVLASYGADTIYLSKNNNMATIDLCDGLGQIRNESEDGSYQQLILESQDSIQLSASGGLYMNCFVESSDLSTSMYTSIHSSVYEPWEGMDDIVGDILIESGSKTLSNGINRTEDIVSILISRFSKIGTMAGTNGTLKEFPAIRFYSATRDEADDLTSSYCYFTNFAGEFWMLDSKHRRAFTPSSRSGNVVIGYGAYDANNGDTNIYGSDVRLFSKTAGADYIPYFTGTDTITLRWRGAGFISGSSGGVYFCVPLAKPVIGNPTVSVSSSDGLVIRQAAKYCYGSASGSPKKPSSYSASLVGGQFVYIAAAMGNTTNVTNNNDSCGIDAGLKITFSFG